MAVDVDRCDAWLCVCVCTHACRISSTAFCPQYVVSSHPPSSPSIASRATVEALINLHSVLHTSRYIRGHGCDTFTVTCRFLVLAVCVLSSRITCVPPTPAVLCPCMHSFADADTSNRDKLSVYMCLRRCGLFCMHTQASCYLFPRVGIIRS